MNMLLRLIIWLYIRLLRLYPCTFRAEFGEEITAVFTEALSDRQQKGWLSLLIWCGREFTSLLTEIMREQWLSLRREEAAMTPILPVNHAHDAELARAETPWEIIAGMVPFILSGLMFTLKGVDYHMPLPWMSHSIVGYLIVHMILIVGVGIGWALRFPRWSYAYLGVIVMTSSWLGWVPLLVLTAVMLLITRSFQPLVKLFRDIQRDWTRLSFAMYAALSWLFLGVAYDGKTWYNQTLYLPLNLFLLTLFFTGGAFFYMRGRRQWPRVLALPAAFILHVPISMLVTTLAGYSGASLTAVGRLILPLVWLVWASVPVWPGFASHVWQRFRPI